MNKSKTINKNLHLLANIQEDVKKNIKIQKNKKQSLKIKIPLNNTEKIYDITIDDESPKICHTEKEYYY